MKTAVITISSRRPHEPYYHLDSFERSCKRQGIDPIFLDAKMWGGLISKPKFLKSWIEREGANWDELIFCDSWDVLFLAPVSEITRKFHALFETPIVFNAETNCFPNAALADQFEFSVFPYRFLNSGFMIAEMGAALDMLKEMELDKIPDDFTRPDGSKWEPNDQLYVQNWYLAHKWKAQLDTSAVLCQSLHDSGEKDFSWDPATQRLTSLITGNQPCCLHGNGSGKVWLKRVIDLAGL